MNQLLDTHTLIWFINGDKQLSAKARKTIEDKDAANFVSIASLWEMAIKISLGKLELKKPFSHLAELLVQNDFSILPVSFEDVQQISNLPFHNRDPFDRLIAVQCLNRSWTLVSKDPIYKEYKVSTIW